LVSVNIPLSWQIDPSIIGESTPLGGTMTKDEAERETVRRWRLLPPHQRTSYEDAEAYSHRLADELEFPSIMSRQRLIAAWLIRDVARHRAELQAETSESASSAEAA
jgi:hypothetical protein